ncbi:hypothetical protein EDF68_1011107 [Ochrobactrum sp. BH3]|nr:hypothetical protein EDF68_1011107 [Ochrobactrum sp. BH3]
MPYWAVRCFAPIVNILRISESRWYSEDMLNAFGVWTTALYTWQHDSAGERV